MAKFTNNKNKGFKGNKIVDKVHMDLHKTFFEKIEMYFQVLAHRSIFLFNNYFAKMYLIKLT